MGPAPLPPHERPWRHPSELGPTAADVTFETSGRGLVVATGAAVSLLAIVMVIALTPPRSSAPTALTATTIASINATGPNAPRFVVAEPTTGSGIVQVNRNTVTLDQKRPLPAAPEAISVIPVRQADEYEPASSLPPSDELVMVMVPSYVVKISWGEIDTVQAPDGAVVTTLSGELIAVFVDGGLRVVAR